MSKGPLVPLTQDGVSRSSTGLTVTRDLTLEQWSKLFVALYVEKESLQWAVGDAANACELQHGDKLQQIADALQVSYQFLRTAKWLSARFPHKLRRDTLGFGFYEVVAKEQKPEDSAKGELSPSVKKALDAAEEKGLTRAEFREIVKNARTKTGERIDVTEDDLEKLGKALGGTVRDALAVLVGLARFGGQVPEDLEGACWWTSKGDDPEKLRKAVAPYLGSRLNLMDVVSRGGTSASSIAAHKVSDDSENESGKKEGLTDCGSADKLATPAAKTVRCASLASLASRRCCARSVAPSVAPSLAPPHGAFRGSLLREWGAKNGRSVAAKVIATWYHDDKVQVPKNVGRDFKLCNAGILPVIAKLSVTPKENSEAVREHEEAEMRGGQLKYGQSFPSFAEHYAAIIAVLRRSGRGGVKDWGFKPKGSFK